MQIKLTFKTPDVLDRIAVEYPGISPEDYASIQDKLGKWIKYGEYVHIDFDLEAMTATVREVS